MGTAFIAGCKKSDTITDTPTVSDDVADAADAVSDALASNNGGAMDQVNDVFETWVDPETFLPVKSIRSVKEQKYRFFDEVLYDHENDSIFSLKSGRKKVPDKVNDLISVFFYIRQNQYFDDLLSGKSFQIPVYHGDELFLMELEYLGLETIDTKIGRKQCYVVSPKVPKGKLLKGSDGLKIYITKDANRLPIYAEFDLVLGALKCELNAYKINGVNQLTEQ